MAESIYKRLNKICMSIWTSTRTELLMSMRHFDNAIYAFGFARNESTKFFGTDGDKIYFNDKYVINTYEKGRVYMNRSYVHMMLHCLYGHLFHRGDRLIDYWNLACDIVVESILDNWNKESIRLPVSGKRHHMYQMFLSEMDVLTAERVYDVLFKASMTPEQFYDMIGEFEVDDHSFWREDNRQPNQPPLPKRQQKWDNIQRKVQMEMEQLGDEAGKSEGDPAMQQMKIANRKRYNYSEFLRKFAVLREVATVDLDSFDYTYYTYGLNMYGNMPFIEPLEWKETMKIQDFVIAIDTSMSCSGELVQAFLEETYSILSDSDQYFSKVNIHILQCDDLIREDVVIHNKSEMEAYMEQFEVKGFGGTDFRPVFDYIYMLRNTKQISNMKGLIYFTDGKGTFPGICPDYETAFVFLQDDFKDVKVPPWAMKVFLDPYDLRQNKVIDYNGGVKL